MKRIDNLKKKARLAIDQTEAINLCIICAPLNDEITNHHPNETNITKASLKIAKCKQCQANLATIINCARHGHLYMKQED